MKNLIKKILKEERDDGLDWIRDINPHPTLQQLFDKGEINEGDVLILRGELQNGRTLNKTWTHDFKISINKVGDTLETWTTFDLETNENQAAENMGVSSKSEISFLKSDGKLEVVQINNKPT